MSLTETTDGYEVNTVSIPREITPQPAHAAIDAGMALTLHLCRLSDHKDLLPLRMEVTRPQPACAEQYHQYFGANILFNSERNLLLFDRHTIEKQLPTANIDLALSCDKIIKDYLINMDKHDVVMQVKTKLIDNLPSGAITEKDIADLLHMSLRSLQRKLEEKGYTYKKLMEDTRRELAEQQATADARETEVVAQEKALKQSAEAFRAQMADRQRRLKDQADALASEQVEHQRCMEAVLRISFI